MAPSRVSSSPEEPEELLSFLNLSFETTYDDKSPREYEPRLEFQSLGSMRIHERMDTTSVAESWKDEYGKESQNDTKLIYGTAESESSHYDDDDDNNTETSPVAQKPTSNKLKLKKLPHDCKSTNRSTDPRFDPSLDESISIGEDETTPRSSYINCYLEPNNFSHYMEQYPSSKNTTDAYHHLEECPFYTSEVSALKFRIVELEYFNAALEGKIRQYREEIRLFKKDVKGYKNDGKRFTQQLKEKNIEISTLHKKIIQLLNHDTLPSPKVSVASPQEVSIHPATNRTKSASDDFTSRSRAAARGNDIQLGDEAQYWV